MKRIASALLGVSLLWAVVQPLPPVHAASSQIKIYIDGSELQADQGPAVINYRTLVPLRAIFEALDAKVTWNSRTETIVAQKGDTTVTLALGSNVATINNTTVYMDVPARTLNNRTLVPVRFVSEALGEDVRWDEAAQSVYITTSSKVYAPSSVSASIVGQQGDGRDIEVRFAKSQQEANINHYRVYVVKASNASAFTLNRALSLSSNVYTQVAKDGWDKRLTLSADMRDTDGSYITSNQAYVIYVVAVSNINNQSALSKASSTITVAANSSPAVASNIKVSVNSNYGDGRDISVSFNRAINETYVSGYRVFVVKSQNAGSFNATAAAAVSSSNYTSIGTTATSVLTTTLQSGTRDTNGDLIRAGVSYRVYVYSVTSNAAQQPSQLSAGSDVFSVGSSSLAPTAPVITAVDNAYSYGDSRDLVVKFNRSNDESKVSEYRVFAVPSSSSGSFTLAAANGVKSGNYVTVKKTGFNLGAALGSGMKDTQGNVLKRNESYRFFVMAVGNASASYSNSLSSGSVLVTLSVLSAVPSATNVKVSDVSDYGDGRDLSVSFTKASNESNISHYRIIVVKAQDASSFNLSSANSVSSANYTVVNKTGASTLSTVLSSTARDTSGEYIRSGVSYRAYILAVSGNAAQASNSLSSSSSAITLKESATITAPSISKVEDVSDYGDGRDIRVAFNKSADESKVQLYRVFVHNLSRSSSTFNLNTANSVAYGNYYEVNKSGANQTLVLPSSMRDTQGNLITTGQQYRVYVLAIGNERANYQNALSSASSTLTLTNNMGSSAVTNVKVSDVSDNGDGRDLLVSFNKASDESRINHYRVLVVKAASADRFNLSSANNVSYTDSTFISKTGSNLSVTLGADARDVDGAAIRNGVSYKVFILSVNDGSLGGSNALSSASAAITLTSNSVAAAVNVTASSANTYGDTRDLEVTYTKPSSEANIVEYRIMVVRADQAGSFNLLSANSVSSGNYTVASRQGSSPKTSLSATARDVQGNLITQKTAYRVFVLAVGDSRVSSGNALSSMSNEIVLTELAAPSVSITSVQDGGNDGSGPSLSVSFNRASNETNIAYYAVMVVPSGRSDSFTLSQANALSASRYTQVNKTGGDLSVLLSSSTLDVDGNVLRSGVAYKVLVLSIADGRAVTTNALSTPSAEIILN